MTEIALAVLMVLGAVGAIAYAVYLEWRAAEAVKRLTGRLGAVERRTGDLERVDAGERLRKLEYATTTAATGPRPAARAHRDATPPPAPRAISVPSFATPPAAGDTTRVYVSPGQASTGERGAS